MTQFSVQTNDFLNNNKTIYEVVMLADKYGNVAGGTGGTSVDAFGRLRVSEPMTLFDSSHRYKDNGLWHTANTAANTTVSFNSAQGLVDLTVQQTANCEIVRETTKVFPYQPGKSLLVFNTFVMETGKPNLRQRIGYFGETNGIYVEQDGSDLYFVKRSFVTGSTVETRIIKSAWNIDKLDGTGPSGKILDITHAQILWMDVEWLGVGTVRVGFVIDGEFVLCHKFNHANLITTTYITTASLPIRYEIKTTGATTSNSTLKQICSSVISEGGYELRGVQQAVSIPITAPITLTTAGTYYPVISLRLKTTALDAVVILTALSILAITNNANYNWQVRATGSTSGGTWTSAGSDSAVEYNITGTSYSGGRVLASGYTNGSNQGSTPVDILKEALFKFQLERNGLTSSPQEITLVATSGSGGAQMFASIDWEEISR
jgi:hypothetical protein